MKSPKRGKNTSDSAPVEVLNISRHGIWMLVKDVEYFLPHEQFPWFAKAPIDAIFEVELLHGIHLQWPLLDVDLHVDSLAHVEHFPLVVKPPRATR